MTIKKQINVRKHSRKIRTRKGIRKVPVHKHSRRIKKTFKKARKRIVGERKTKGSPLTGGDVEPTGFLKAGDEIISISSPQIISKPKPKLSVQQIIDKIEKEELKRSKDLTALRAQSKAKEGIVIERPITQPKPKQSRYFGGYKQTETPKKITSQVSKSPEMLASLIRQQELISLNKDLEKAGAFDITKWGKPSKKEPEVKEDKKYTSHDYRHFAINKMKEFSSLQEELAKTKGDPKKIEKIWKNKKLTTKLDQMEKNAMLSLDSDFSARVKDFVKGIRAIKADANFKERQKASTLTDPEKKLIKAGEDFTKKLDSGDFSIEALDQPKHPTMAPWKDPLAEQQKAWAEYTEKMKKGAKNVKGPITETIKPYLEQVKSKLAQEEHGLSGIQAKELGSLTADIKKIKQDRKISLAAREAKIADRISRIKEIYRSKQDARQQQKEIKRQMDKFRKKSKYRTNKEFAESTAYKR